MITEQLAPVHPGEILKKEFMKPKDMSTLDLTKALSGISYHEVRELLEGFKPLTIQMAYWLSKEFETTAQFWMNLQKQYDVASNE